MNASATAALLRSALVLTGLSLLASCTSSRGYTGYAPPPVPPIRPFAQGDCSRNFEPCRCKIEEFQVDTLDKLLSQSNWSPARRQEVVANLSSVASYYTREYWLLKQQDDALRALRYYGAFLSLVSLSDPSAPYALLQSIAIYCDLGCRAKVNDLVAELKSNYRYQQADLDTVLLKCR